MKTKYGNATINNQGYYQISSIKEGNFGKLLHRLVFEDYHNCKLDSKDTIHHIDFDKTNNHPANLICMSRKAHGLLHNIGNPKSEESKKKMSEAKKGIPLSDETKLKVSESKNTTGYYRVCKQKNKKCKQGFVWNYRYYENGKRKTIVSVNLEKLEVKVKAKRLEWREL